MYLKKEVVHLRMQLNSCTWVPALNMGNSWNFWRKMTQIHPYPNISHVEREYFSGRTLRKSRSVFQGCTSEDYWTIAVLEKHHFPLKNTDRSSFIKYRASVILAVLSVFCLEMQLFTFSSFQGSYRSSFYHSIKNEKANPQYFTAFFHAVWLDLYDPSYLWSQAHSSAAIKNL